MSHNAPGRSRSRAPLRPRVIIAGGGVAALEATLVLDELAGGRVEIVVLSASPDFHYRPLAVAEPFGVGRAHRLELAGLLEGHSVEIVVDALEWVDHERGELGTAGGRIMSYDALLVAVGARQHKALPGALTFFDRKGPAELNAVLQAADAGRIERLVFAVPSAVNWTLPAYELALMSAAQLEASGGLAADVMVVTAEPRPAAAFGSRGSAAVDEMLRLRGVTFHSAAPLRAEPGRLVVSGRHPLAADTVIALPGVESIHIDGLPCDERGFLRVDEHGRVRRAPGVYAAGEATDYPVKQGGVAAQQADAAAMAIAADLGCDVCPAPFRPMLRGLLVAGRAPRHLPIEAVRGGVRQAAVRGQWPPAKINGRLLAPLLVRHGVVHGAPPGAVAVELAASGTDQ